ncbi:GTP-binding protein EngB [Seminavis robusta]|uniref:GTP-binding protein EngB n=1 Tax=Seminavis robusta TaxID=568900 RepID=A0A9N8EMC8_9STRA|nr:GTP-binding protein EngB [Seminavis robusta]|eukprot:Sro1330_g263390.1 GTP-binding protein EngB (497) ;mRNA; r:11748-13349
MALSLATIGFLLTANQCWGFQPLPALPNRYHNQYTNKLYPHQIQQVPPPLFFHKSSSSSQLLAAKRRSNAGSGNSNNNKKKNSKGTAPTKSKSKEANPPKKSSAAASDTNNNNNNTQGRQHRAPPWQVLSKKDAKKNVAVEKRRRERIQQGLQPEEKEQQPQQVVSKAFLSHVERSFLSWKRFNPSSASSGMKFVASVLDRQLPPRIGVPEIAFLGRSNVGKSSLLNRLSSFSRKQAGFNDEARVGKTPGATASVNLYAFYNKKEKPLLGFVDLPGFGYAKLSKDIKESVQQTAERYLDTRRELVLGILLVDIRRVPTEDDRIVLAALYDMGVPIVVVATKVDKISSNSLERQLLDIRNGLGLPEGQPLCVSSVTGEGTKQLWNVIMEGAEIGVEEYRNKFHRGEAEDDQQLDATFNDDESDEVEEEESYYSQGYDWVQSEAYSRDRRMEEDDYYEQEDDDNFDDNGSDENTVPIQKISIKDLRRKARRLERDNMV